MNVLHLAKNVCVSLFHPEGVHAFFNGTISLPASATLNEPLQLFEAILQRQTFACGVAFGDFDVSLSGDLVALYRQEHFSKMWRIAGERLGLAFTSFAIDNEISASGASLVSREGLVVDVLHENERPYSVRLRGSQATKQFTGSDLTLVVRTHAEPLRGSGAAGCSRP